MYRPFEIAQKGEALQSVSADSSNLPMQRHGSLTGLTLGYMVEIQHIIAYLTLQILRYDPFAQISASIVARAVAGMLYILTFPLLFFEMLRTWVNVNVMDMKTVNLETSPTRLSTYSILGV